MFSRHKTSDNKGQWFWNLGNKWGEPGNCLERISMPWCRDGEMREHREPWLSSQLKRWDWESRAAKVTRVHRTKEGRAALQGENPGDLQKIPTSSIQQSTDERTCVRKLSEARERPSKRTSSLCLAGESTSGTHTGPQCLFPQRDCKNT